MDVPALQWSDLNHKGKIFLLQSLNPIYLPYKVNAEEVLEVWQFHSLHTTNLPEGATDMDRLMKMMQEMKAEIKSIRNG
ncbi:hypothetical protein DU508_16900 [Pedobacter chinensis]|uniref:Uncharacterized protein n=1 Tax=Pedobacter chinensis TaxID=2282421 RepID=A0A369PVJ2_9SPHI|nr:hypothetical protein DU508_16900 [Pedobacter chinensis]